MGRSHFGDRDYPFFARDQKVEAKEEWRYLRYFWASNHVECPNKHPVTYSASPVTKALTIPNLTACNPAIEPPWVRLPELYPAPVGLSGKDYTREAERVWIAEGFDRFRQNCIEGNVPRGIKSLYYCDYKEDRPVWFRVICPGFDNHFYVVVDPYMELLAVFDYPAHFLYTHKSTRVPKIPAFDREPPKEDKPEWSCSATTINFLMDVYDKSFNSRKIKFFNVAGERFSATLITAFLKDSEFWHSYLQPFKANYSS